MRIIAFYPTFNDKLENVIRHLAKGIPGCELRPLGKYVECDIAIIFGAYKNIYSPTWPKKEILEKHQGRRLIMVESAFVKRGEYYQVGWGGYAGNADFNNENSPPDRWDKLQIRSNKWLTTGEKWVVMGQVPWDTQVQDMNHVKWCQDTVAELETLGREAVFRPHPRIKEPEKYGIDEKYTDCRTLDQLLTETAAVVTWNSTSSLDAIIKGVPAVTMDPSSICYPITSHSIHERIIYPDRKQFFNDLGYSMWTLKEMASGETWKHLNA